MKTLRLEAMVSFAPSQVVLMSIKVDFFGFNVFSSTYLFLRKYFPFASLAIFSNSYTSLFMNDFFRISGN